MGLAGANRLSSPVPVAAAVRQGVHCVVRHPHEGAHLAPLAGRLRDVRASGPDDARVVVWSDTRPPERRAWNVQLFHGLGDKGYTGNPLFLQRGRYPRLRTALNRIAHVLGMEARFLEPPTDPGRRGSRYQQVNAYGPRLADHLESILEGAVVSRFGHVALNERGPPRLDPEGPLLWMPTWDNRRYLGGADQSSLGAFAHEVALVSRHVPVRVKYHPLTVAHHQDLQARRELQKEPGVQAVAPEREPYGLLDGIRGILTDTSSLGFEAYCIGVPVAIARPPGVVHRGLHAELAERVDVLSPGKPDLLRWAESPPEKVDQRWADELLYRPERRRNDEFAADLRGRLGAP